MPRRLNLSREGPSQARVGGSMDSWSFVLSFSAVAAAIFAYSFLLAA
jgi:hypothetical protein